MHRHLALTMGDTLEINAARFSDVTAYVCGERSRTHAELLLRARKLASAWYKLGLRRQDRVAILAMNELEFCEVYAAGEWSGFITATVNFRLAPPEMQYIINDCTPRVLVFEAQYADVIERMKPELKSVETFVCIGKALPWAAEYEEVLSSGDDAGPPFRAIEDDIAYLIYTSGTTGRPKGCILGQREERLAAQLLSADQGSGPTDRTLLVMPFFHVGAKGIQIGQHFRGGTVYIHRAFNADELLRTIERERITITHLAPTMVQMLLDSPLAKSTDVSSLKTLIYAAAPMPLPLLERGLEMFGNVFMQMYGQTEVVSSGLLQDQHRLHGTARERARLASAGQPFPNVFIRVVDDQGRDCPVGTPGEVIVKTTAMFRGYWNNSAATLETMRDGWCHSGDIGKLDADGFLYIVDRKKDMIISGGENIYSLEVEEAVLRHAAVHEVAVIGVPDEKWGEAVRAVVVLKSGMTASQEEIIEHCRTQIAGYKRPKSVVFATEIPKLPSGKVNKVALRNQYGKA